MATRSSFVTGIGIWNVLGWRAPLRNGAATSVKRFQAGHDDLRGNRVIRSRRRIGAQQVRSEKIDCKITRQPEAYLKRIWQKPDLDP